MSCYVIMEDQKLGQERVDGITWRYSAYVVASIRTKDGHAQLFSSPQSRFRNLKETLPQSQLRNFLQKCCSATPQFRNPHRPQLESFTSRNFQHIFGHGIA
jgi:hypothetical protein